MRIAIVSDIHGNLAALEAVVADIGRQRVDAVVNLGDSLSGPLLPRETARFLMAQDWTHLAGNHDRQILELHAGSGASDAYAHAQLTPRELDWLATLRPTLQYNEDLFLCHGTPSSDLACLLETAERHAGAADIEQRLGRVDASLVACGHTHVARSVRSARGLWLVNPGSVGQPAYTDDHPYPHAIESGSPDARYAIVERRQQQWLVQLLTIPYDHRSMAELASANGREDWAVALMTGYMPARE